MSFPGTCLEASQQIDLNNNVDSSQLDTPVQDSHQTSKVTRSILIKFWQGIQFGSVSGSKWPHNFPLQLLANFCKLPLHLVDSTSHIGVRGNHPSLLPIGEFVPSNISTKVCLRLLYSTVLQCINCPQIVHESWWIQSLEDAIIHVAQNS
jgi:hypothetical protein